MYQLWKKKIQWESFVHESSGRSNSKINIKIEIPELIGKWFHRIFWKLSVQLKIAYSFYWSKFHIFIRHRQMMSTVGWIGRWFANYLQYFDNFISELEMQTKIWNNKSVWRKKLDRYVKLSNKRNQKNLLSGKHLHYKVAKEQIQVITNIESVEEIHFIFRRLSTRHHQFIRSKFYKRNKDDQHRGRHSKCPTGG